MKITTHTRDRLVLESKPKASFGIAAVLGAVASGAALDALILQDNGLSKDTLFGLVLGPLILCGSALLYRETRTIFDRKSGLVTWKQHGLITFKTEQFQLDRIKDVVIGRPISDQSGGAKQLNLVLEDRSIPLMFGCSACNRDTEIRAAIMDFLEHAKS